MNELFLSGTILTLVKTPTTGDTSHVVCQLRHSHRNRQQQVIHETYTVHAWNRLADWAVQTLKPGARVYVKGYLTQKLRGDVVMTEVTAAQFFVQSLLGWMRRISWQAEKNHQCLVKEVYIYKSKVIVSFTRGQHISCCHV